MQKPNACEGCPAYAEGIGFAPPEPITPETAFAVIGQGPGEQETIFNRPFYDRAPSGRMLRGWLADADITSFACANIVQCWLPKVKLSGELGKESREPKPEEAAFCRTAHLQPWLDALPAHAHVIPVGAVALRFLLSVPLRAKAPAIGVTITADL